MVSRKTNLSFMAILLALRRICMYNILASCTINANSCVSLSGIMAGSSCPSSVMQNVIDKMNMKDVIVSHVMIIYLNFIFTKENVSKLSVLKC